MDDFTAEELERFRELMERANRELDERNELSQTTRDELDKFNSKLKSSTGDTTKTLKRLGNALTSYTGELYKGSRGASVAAGAATSMTTALGKAAAGLLPFGTAITGATKVLNTFISAAAEQEDAQFDALRGLQRFGAAANDGTEGIQNTLVGFNLMSDQYEDMVRILGENASSLALFKGTISDARIELSEVGRVMKNRGITHDLMLLGMRAEDITEAFVDFTAMQSEVGMSQRRNTLELANASGNYLKEMNALSKATGLEREMLEEKIKSMREEERFRAFTAGLRAEGRGDLALDAEILTSAMSGLFDEQTAKGFRDILAGDNLSSEEAVALANTMNRSTENVLQIAEDFKNRDLTSEETLQLLAEGLGESAEANRDLSRLSGALERSGNFISGATTERALILSLDNIAEALTDAREEQTGETEAPEAAVDRQANIRQNQIETNQNLRDIVENTKPLNSINEGISSIASSVTGVGANALGTGTTRGDAGRSGTGTAEPDAASGRRASRNTASGGIQDEATTSAYSRADMRSIPDLISQYASYVGTGQEISLSNLVQNQNLADEMAKYIGIGASQPIELSPKTIGKMVMARMGLQSSGSAEAGEEYRDVIRRHLREEFGAGNIEEFRQGGIATGPRSGYLAELHGTEAIVPLSGGSIPVTISNLESKISGPIQQLAQRMDIAEDLIMNTANQQTETVQTRVENPESTRRLAEQTGALREQISRLDRLIAVSQSNNNIMSKILQNSYA